MEELNAVLLGLVVTVIVFILQPYMLIEFISLVFSLPLMLRSMASSLLDSFLQNTLNPPKSEKQNLQSVTKSDASVDSNNKATQKKEETEAVPIITTTTTATATTATTPITTNQKNDSSDSVKSTSPETVTITAPTITTTASPVNPTPTAATATATAASPSQLGVADQQKEGKRRLSVAKQYETHVAEQLRKSTASPQAHRRNVSLHEREVVVADAIEKARTKGESELDLSNQSLVLVPGRLREFNKITVLNLSHNSLASLSLWFFQSLPHLKSLDLSYNQFFELPKQFAKLSTLEHLNLSFNRLEFLSNGLFECQNLLTLNVSNNNLIVLPPQISKLEKITELNISHNCIMHLPEDVTKLKKLKTFRFNDNKLLHSTAHIMQQLSSNGTDSLEQQMDMQAEDEKSLASRETASDKTNAGSSASASAPTLSSSVTVAIETAAAATTTTPATESKSETSTTAAMFSSLSEGDAKVVQDRVNVLVEILESERRYGKYLRVLETLYFEPFVHQKYPTAEEQQALLNATAGGGNEAAATALSAFVTLLQEVCPTIDPQTFPQGFDTILSFNRDILAELEKCIPNPPEGFTTPNASGRQSIAQADAVKGEYMMRAYMSKVGKVFRERAPFFKVYVTFISNFQKASTIISNGRANDENFERLLRAGQELQSADYLDLVSILVMPIQRIPRYKMLLESLIRRTPKDHADYADLESAIVSVSNNAMYINNKLNEMNNRMRVIEIQEQVGISELVQPWRHYIREGKVKTRDNRKALLYVFNDVIVVGSLVTTIVFTSRWDYSLHNLDKVSITAFEFIPPPPPPPSLLAAMSAESGDDALNLAMSMITRATSPSPDGAAPSVPANQSDNFATPQKEFGFALSWGNDSTRLEFVAPSETVRDVWVRDLENALRARTNKK